MVNHSPSKKYTEGDTCIECKPGELNCRHCTIVRYSGYAVGDYREPFVCYFDKSEGSSWDKHLKIVDHNNPQGIGQILIDHIQSDNQAYHKFLQGSFAIAQGSNVTINVIEEGNMWVGFVHHNDDRLCSQRDESPDFLLQKLRRALN